MSFPLLAYARSHRTKPEPPSPPTPTLTLQTADLIQALMCHGIPQDTVRVLIRKHGDQRVVLVLASVPHWKSKKPAAVIQDALKRPEKWPIPAAVAQKDLNLLTGTQCGINARSAPPALSPSDRQPIAPTRYDGQRAAQTDQTLEDFAECFDDADNDALEREIWSRLSQTTRQKILEYQDAELPIPPLFQSQWDGARKTILKERLPEGAPHAASG